MHHPKWNFTTDLTTIYRDKAPSMKSKATLVCIHLVVMVMGRGCCLEAAYGRAMLFGDARTSLRRQFDAGRNRKIGAPRPLSFCMS